MDLYYRSVGHNATLLLNFPVDRRTDSSGDSANAVRFHEMIQQQLKTNLVAGMTPKVSNERGGDFVASALTDDNFDTYWATEDRVTTADIEFSFDTPTPDEPYDASGIYSIGTACKAFVVEYLDKGYMASGETEWKKLLPLDTNVCYVLKRWKQRVYVFGLRMHVVRLCLSNVGVYDAGNVPIPL